MNKTHTTKRWLSALLAAVMALGLLFTAVVPASAAGSLSITISYSDGTGFWIAPGSRFAVAADAAEDYGYEDSFGGGKTSALDAVVAAVAAIYGEDKDAVNEALKVSGGGISDFLGHGYNFIYLVNDVLPGDTPVTDYELHDGDSVALYALQEDYADDVLVWFEQDGQKITSIQAEAGAPFEVTVKGIGAFGWGDWAMPEDSYAGAGIVPVTLEDSGLGFQAGRLGDTPIAVSDANGKAVITLPTAGKQVLSAVEWDSDTGVAVITPWLEVTVVKPLAEEKADAKAALAAYRNAADYRDAEKAALAAAITAGSEAIDKAADAAGVASALAAAKAAIDAIKTYAQLTQWWESPPLNPFWHWVLRYLLFGWIWMEPANVAWFRHYILFGWAKKA
ncbi:MAG: hypothetical protein LBG83_05370 [Oscillospiraceae bacterium]|jgi:hypothetical protein|nr:hypothetical protein [Oscillospiraceae bacterium]